MFSALANHLWQSTLVAAAAALLALTLRKNHARTRYWLWLVASLKFLVPFSLLVAAGSYFSWPAVSPVSKPGFSVVVEQFSQPFSQPLSKVQPVTEVIPLLTPHHDSHISAILLGLWASGSLMILFFWLKEWRRIRAALRRGRLLPSDMPVPVVSSPSVLEPGVFGIFRPVLLLPQGITEHLAPAHLKAIVAHELCHVRHRDNLASAIHMAVEAIFWFHPLVWWLGARMVDERERACDEEVLNLGNRPEIYAESILKTCEFYLQSPLACMSGVTGSDLKKRIGRIMTQRISNKLDLGKKLLLVVAAIAIVSGPLVFGVLHAAPQTQAESKPGPSFEVATIKPDKSGDQRRMLMMEPGGRFNANGVSLKMLLEDAYNIKDSQLIGAPSWLESERYNIQAKPDDAEAEKLRKLPREQAHDEMMAMMRGLIEDRCKLKFSHETRDLPIYSLVVGKDGPKFQKSAVVELANPELRPDETRPDGPAGPNSKGGGPRMGQGIRMGRGELTMMTAPLDLFANVLSRQLGRPVINNTGLSGNYDFTLKWTPDQSEGQMMGGPGGPPPGDAPPPPEANGPSIFTAVQEQLGLKLEAQKAPMQVLVIDHIERPSEN